MYAFLVVDWIGFEFFDLVHGTWVADQKVEPDACVEVKEGDVIRIGGSTRIYRLHWIPLSRTYDSDNPFVPPSTPMEQDEEPEAENLVVARQVRSTFSHNVFFLVAFATPLTALKLYLFFLILLGSCYFLCLDV